jgi:hypothetical protein
MYTFARDNHLYSLDNGIDHAVTLYQGREKVNICQLLSDVSLWITDSQEYITNYYLPLAVLAVGTNNTNIGAFFMGFFLGKTFESKNLRVNITARQMSREDILDLMHKNIYKYNGALKHLGESTDAKKFPEET